jgi:hypothetical protein
MIICKIGSLTALYKMMVQHYLAGFGQINLKKMVGLETFADFNSHITAN